jgi:hypothetical protein
LKHNCRLNAARLVVDRAGQKDIADDGNGTPQIGTRTSVTGDIDGVSMCLNPSVDLFTRWYASVTSGGKILRTQIEIPNEYLKDPRGYRAFIVDYDSSNDAFRRPKAIASLSKSVDGSSNDPFRNWSDAALLRGPDFRAFMSYGIVMKTLSRFEYALGRRLRWSFGSHQIQIAPHAFSDANAFYSDRAEGLYI